MVVSTTIIHKTAVKEVYKEKRTISTTTTNFQINSTLSKNPTSPFTLKILITWLLIGKKILPTLRARIIKERPPKLYLALDPDAYKDSYNEIEYFINNGLSVYYVNLQDKDPNETGHEGMLKALENAKQISFFDLIQFKMNL